jgi:hypothetical protein
MQSTIMIADALFKPQRVGGGIKYQYGLLTSS